MKVRWLLPDQTVHDQDVSDIEQLLFLLRMVGTVAIKGGTYRIGSTELSVEGNGMTVVVTLITVSA